MVKYPIYPNLEDRNQITFSASSTFIKRLNKYLLRELYVPFKNTTISAYLTKNHYRYYLQIPVWERSNVFKKVIITYLNEIDKNIKIKKKLFLSRCELVRTALMNELIKPPEKRIINEYLLNYFLKIFKPSIPSLTRKLSRGYVKLGNIHHKNGEWKKYHDKKDLKKFEIFQEINEKVKDYYSERHVSQYFRKFKQAHEDGLLDKPLTEKQLKKIYKVVIMNE